MDDMLEFVCRTSCEAGSFAPEKEDADEGEGEGEYWYCFEGGVEGDKVLAEFGHRGCRALSV